jgi:hypothetical protein
MREGTLSHSEFSSRIICHNFSFLQKHIHSHLYNFILRHKSTTMPGPLLNFTIFTKSTPHALRAISLATFIPAFIILLIAGIGLEAANPAIGIVPLFFSSAFSALLLANEKKCGCQASGLAGTPVHLIFDLTLGLSLLLFTIMGWLSMGGGRADRGFVVLGTYGTNFMVINLYVFMISRALNIC